MVRYREFHREAGLENSLAPSVQVVGFQLQPNRSEAAQELPLVGDVPVEKPDEEVVPETNEIPLGILLRDLTAENVTVELADVVARAARYENGGVVSKNDLGHGGSFQALAFGAGFSCNTGLPVSNRDLRFESTI